MQDESTQAKLQALAAKQQRGERLRSAHIATIAYRAGDEARKVQEVAFINALTSEDKKLCLQQRLEEGGGEVAGAWVSWCGSAGMWHVAVLACGVWHVAEMLWRGDATGLRGLRG